jgi:hypothetical protein
MRGPVCALVIPSGVQHSEHSCFSGTGCTSEWTYHRRSSQTGRTAMNCLTCKDLDRALASWRSKAIEARSAAYYRVSTELAARINVDMERARLAWKSTSWDARRAKRYMRCDAFCSRNPNRGPSRVSSSISSRAALVSLLRILLDENRASHKLAFSRR